MASIAFIGVALCTFVFLCLFVHSASRDMQETKHFRLLSGKNDKENGENSYEAKRNLF